jgi:hypothetical protein
MGFEQLTKKRQHKGLNHGDFGTFMRLLTFRIVSGASGKISSECPAIDK